MQCDLKKIFGELAANLPTTFDGNDDITFSAENLPVLPAELTTDQLFIQKSLQEWQYTYLVDRLEFFASKELYTHLGLLIMSKIFKPEFDEATIRLSHPKSDIKILKVEFHLGYLHSGYHLRPYAFVYYPEKTEKHPFDSCVDPHDLPCFGLTNEKDFVMTDDDRLNRDTVVCFGSDSGLVRFAELLLNVGQDGNNVSEYELEGEGGFRGVGVHSANIRLWLPDSEEYQWRMGQHPHQLA